MDPACMQSGLALVDRLLWVIAHSTLLTFLSTQILNYQKTNIKRLEQQYILKYVGY